MDEQLDIVDNSGKVLRQAAKKEAHVHGWLHKTVIGYLRRGADWTLARQSADRQEPGQLVAPVGGHVRAGESDLQALLRESEEEIGIRNVGHRYIGRVPFRRQIIGRDENHLFVIYEITTGDTITLGSEATSLEHFTKDELKRAFANRPAEFGESFYFVLEHFYPEYLPATYRKRWTK